MTTSTSNLLFDNSTLAHFKAWGGGISAGIAAIGWTQTTDTGQVNWTTIASVPSSTYVYEIWKSADALSSTLPIFFKIEYGFSSTAVQMRLSVGTSSNGSGTINGTTCTSIPWNIGQNTTTNQGTATFPCYFSGDTGNLYMYLWSNNVLTPAISIVVVIERSKDTSGVDTADYFTTLTFNNTTIASNCFQQTITTAGAGLRDNKIVCLALSSGSNTGLVFGTTAAFPVFPSLGKIGNPLKGLLTVYGSDVANGATCTVTSMYGTTHTYISGYPATNAFTSSLGGSANVGMLMLYE